MTRETKIGLLVGLAFIIAVGILLSDHLSTSDEPTPARLASAGNVMRSSLGDGTDDGDPVAAAAPGVVRVPRSVAPADPVPTAGELAAARARRVPAAPPPVGPAVPTDADQLVPALAASDEAVPPGSNPALVAAARRAGQEVVAPDGPPAVPPRRATARTVEAESGDSLGSLAERAYGSNTRANRDALLAANPPLKADPDRIVVGHAYVVAAAATPPAASAAGRPAAPAKPAVAVIWYTVQAGDTLWSIASERVGTHGAVAALRDLNKDVLVHGDAVRPHMRLRLPKSKVSAD